MANISVCMIVKNEAGVLARCLESLGDVPDEIIVVDTGSTDATKAVAARFTDKIFDYAWADDFAAARNFSLARARCDYIYVADADEVIDEENLARFKQLKEALLPEVEVVEMAYAQFHDYQTTENFEVEYRPKLFRRLRAFQFADPIHEALRTDPVVYRSNVVVFHRPTGSHAGRDLALLGRLAAEHYGFSGRLEMMYARELMMAGTTADFDAAQPYFEALRANPARQPDRVRRAACVLAKGAALRGDCVDLLRAAAPELVGTPPSEICCALGDYYLGIDDTQQAADWYTAALSGAAPELVADSVGSQPLNGLAACFEAAGDMRQAAAYRKRADEWRAENLKLRGGQA